MELYESAFKKFLNMAKVMKMVGEGAEELDTSDSISFDQAKTLGLLPMGKNTSDRLRDKHMRYFTVTKPNEDGWSKVIYWIESEVADKVGDDFSLDTNIDASLYS